MESISNTCRGICKNITRYKINMFPVLRCNDSLVNLKKTQYTENIKEMQSLVSECLIFFTVFHFTQNKKSSSVVMKVWKNTIFKDLNKSKVRSDVRSILSAWVKLNWNFESESKNKKDNRIDFRSTELCIVYFVVWITAIYTLGFSIFFSLI